MLRVSALLCEGGRDDPAWFQKLMADYAAFKASEKERRRALWESRCCRCPQCGHVHKPTIFHATGPEALPAGANGGAAAIGA